MRRAARRGKAAAATPCPLAAQWNELHDRAAVLAAMAQLSSEPFGAALAAFPDRIRAADEWQRVLVKQGVEDIEAMMQPGLAALETLQRRGVSTTAPALALWREFYTARGALLDLAPLDSTSCNSTMFDPRQG